MRCKIRACNNGKMGSDSALSGLGAGKGRIRPPGALHCLSITPLSKVLTLDFSEGIEPKFSGIKLTGPADAIIQTGKVERNAQNEKQMIVPLESALQPGAYTVEWHVVSVDGHKTQGNYHFTVK